MSFYFNGYELQGVKLSDIARAKLPESGGLYQKFFPNSPNLVSELAELKKILVQEVPTTLTRPQACLFFDLCGFSEFKEIEVPLGLGSELKMLMQKYLIKMPIWQIGFANLTAEKPFEFYSISSREFLAQNWAHHFSNLNDEDREVIANSELGDYFGDLLPIVLERAQVKLKELFPNQDGWLFLIPRFIELLNDPRPEEADFNPSTQVAV